MKIYVFTYHTACENEYLGTENKVFRTKKEALKAFKEWKEDEIEIVKRYGWEIGINTDEHFEAYEEGDYCANHTEGFINDYEI